MYIYLYYKKLIFFCFIDKYIYYIKAQTNAFRLNYS